MVYRRRAIVGFSPILFRLYFFVLFCNFFPNYLEVSFFFLIFAPDSR